MTPTSDKIIRWGIMGPGKVARKFANDLREVPNAELYGIASRIRAEQMLLPTNTMLQKLLAAMRPWPKILAWMPFTFEKRSGTEQFKNITMKIFVFTIPVMLLIMLSASSLWAQTTELTGQTEPFYYNVPLSGLSMGVTALLILLFVAWRYLSARKKTTT